MPTRRIVQLAFALLPVFAPALASAEAVARCASESIAIDTEFAASALHECRFKSESMVEIVIKPEDEKVTIEQPWYAFRVTASEPSQLQMRLKFIDGYARFWPKLSRDLVHWQRVDESAVTVSSSNTEMNIEIDVDNDSIFVAAQEVLPVEWYERWFEQLAQHPEVAVVKIGESIEGRAIRLAKNASTNEAIILIGRQHPAEVPGALAMRDFVDTILADTELAQAFRERFTLLIMPLLNPDGVANGHWRHNAGETDLNRDWGIFTQPETQAVAGLLTDLDTVGIQPRLMLDFHTTKETEQLLFYTQAADEATDPLHFDLNWFAAVRKRLPEFDFVHDPRPSQTSPNTKGYFHRRYGIPAFTYELGDEADRALLHETTPIFAEEMMREMLRAN